jgi:hypothetical protein
MTRLQCVRNRPLLALDYVRSATAGSLPFTRKFGFWSGCLVSFRLAKEVRR